MTPQDCEVMKKSFHFFLQNKEIKNNGSNYVRRASEVGPSLKIAEIELQILSWLDNATYFVACRWQCVVKMLPWILTQGLLHRPLQREQGLPFTLRDSLYTCDEQLKHLFLILIFHLYVIFLRWDLIIKKITKTKKPVQCAAQQLSSPSWTNECTSARYPDSWSYLIGLLNNT